MNDVEHWAVSMFAEIGGSAWYEKLVLGGITVIAFLLVAIVLIGLYLAVRR